MKGIHILTTVLLFTSILPAFANSEKAVSTQQMRWNMENLRISDVRFNPDFMTLSVPASNSKGNNFNLVVECGNNPNFFYRQVAPSGRVTRFDRDEDLVKTLCTQGKEIRDLHIVRLLSTANCNQINLQYGIRSIPVAYYGELAKRKDRNGNGMACDLEF